MGNIMSKLIKSSILSSVGLIILGVLLIIQSEATIISISYIIGGLLVALGILSGIKYIRNTKEGKKNELDIIYGIVCIVLGVLVITNPNAIASVIPLVIGFVIIINSALKLQYSLELKRETNNLWKSTMILSLITLICGLVLIFNPFKGALLITKIIGVLIIVYSILDLISTFTIRKTLKRIHKAIEEKIEEAEVVEDNTNIEKRKRKLIKEKNDNKKEDEE